MIRRLLHKGTSIFTRSHTIGQQTARGMVLSLTSRFLIKGVQFVRTIVLARLLFPEDFGLFGLAALIMAATDVFLQPGFNAAIVQYKGDVTEYLNSAWTYNLLRNIAIALLLIFVGGPIAAVFFSNDAVLPLVRMLSIGIIFAGLENIGIVLLDRELLFNKKFYYQVSYILAEVFVVIIAAIILRNPWALVIGAVASRAAAMVFSYVYSTFRPKISFRISGAKELFKYGKWIGILSLVTFLVSQGDYLAIGKLLTTEDLGYYQLAFGLGVLPAVELARHFQSVLFPLYSRIQDDKKFLRRAYIKISRVIFSLAIPASTGLYVLSYPIINVVYGERWLPMLVILKVIIMFGFLKSFEALATPVFMGVGKPKVSTFVLGIQAAIMYIFIVPLTVNFGAVGTAWAVFIGSLAAQLMIIVLMRREISLGFKGFFEMMSLPLTASGIMAITLYSLTGLVSIDSALLLFGFIALGGIVYVVTLFMLDNFSGKHFMNSIFWLKKNI